MSTKFFFRAIQGSDSTPPGALSSDVDLLLALTVDISANSALANTVTGPTSGVQIGATPRSWWTNPLSAVTISGAITKNLWMSESNMSANVGAQVIIDRCANDGTFISTITDSEFGTELPVTTRAAQNWATGTVTSTTLADGDRIRVRVYGNDVGTMATGFTFDFNAGEPSAGVDGDSFVTFTETITEYVAPLASSRTPTVSIPAPGRKTMGPPMLAFQRWLDYSSPAVTTSVDLTTAGAITFTGQTLATTTTVALTAGQVTFTGQALTVSLDVPHIEPVFTILPGLRKAPSPRGPPLLVRQRFDSYVAGTVTTAVSIDTPGALTFTGQAIASSQAQSVVAGSVMFTGQTLSTSTTVALTAGAITFTGQTLSTITATIVPLSAPGAVTFTGQSVATITTVALSPGALTFTGQSLGVQTVAPLTAGAITLTGQTLATVSTVNLDAGAITFTGQTLTVVTSAPTASAIFPMLPVLKVGTFGPPILVRQRFDSFAAFTIVDLGTAGQITFTGQTLATSTSVALAPGAVTFTGQTLATTTSVALTAGAITFTGQSLGVQTVAPLTAGAITFTGQALATSTAVALAPGSITFTGQDLPISVTQPTAPAIRPSLPGRLKALLRGPPILVRQRFDAPQAIATAVSLDTPAQITFTGQSLAIQTTVALTPGAVTFTGQTLGLRNSVALTPGAVTFTGQALSTSTSMALTAGAVTFTGQSLNVARAVILSAGAVTFTGQALGVKGTVALAPGAVTFTGGSVVLLGAILPSADAAGGAEAAETSGALSGATASGGSTATDSLGGGATGAASSTTTGGE